MDKALEPWISSNKTQNEKARLSVYWSYLKGILVRNIVRWTKLLVDLKPIAIFSFPHPSIPTFPQLRFWDVGALCWRKRMMALGSEAIFTCRWAAATNLLVENQLSPGCWVLFSWLCDVPCGMGWLRMINRRQTLRLYIFLLGPSPSGKQMAYWSSSPCLFILYFSWVF